MNDTADRRGGGILDKRRGSCPAHVEFASEQFLVQRTVHEFGSDTVRFINSIHKGGSFFRYSRSDSDHSIRFINS